MWLRRASVYAAMMLTFSIMSVAQANERVIHSFGSGPQDWCPNPGLTVDSAGNLYGTTYCGGTCGAGSLYELSPSNGNWTEAIIYSFCSGLGAAGTPSGGGLLFDGKGNLYGASEGGGAYDAGAVFELSPGGEGWTETVLYSFQ